MCNESYVYMCIIGKHSSSISGSLWRFWWLSSKEVKKVKVTQSCPTLCNPMDYRVHGILQTRILEWVAFPFSRESSQLRDWAQVSRIAGRFFISWAIREAQLKKDPSEHLKNLAYRWSHILSCKALQMSSISDKESRQQVRKTRTSSTLRYTSITWGS